MATAFKVPIEDKIAILAFSERYPTYYDLCVADSAYATCCYGATTTFPGMQHSGDINEGIDLLHHITIDKGMSMSHNAHSLFDWDASNALAPVRTSALIPSVCLSRS